MSSPDITRPVEDETVGLIGYGAMGTVFADELARNGTPPLVFDADPGARDRARAKGFEVAEDLAELASRCSIMSIIVRFDADVLDVVSGERGIATSIMPGAVAIVHSTVSLPVTKQAAEVLAARGAFVVDACPTETPSGVLNGWNGFLTGGAKSDVDRVRDHLLRMGSAVLHMGPLGAGNAAKMVKNLVIAAERLCIAEALQLGESIGLSYVDVLTMLEATQGGNSTLLTNWAKVFDPTGGSSAPAPGINLFQKDVPLAAEAARAAGLALPLTFALEQAGRALLESTGEQKK